MNSCSPLDHRFRHGRPSLLPLIGILLVCSVLVETAAATQPPLPLSTVQWYRTVNASRWHIFAVETVQFADQRSLIVAMDERGFVEAFDPSNPVGAANWTYQLNTTGMGELRALIVKGGTVVVASAFNLAAVNAVNGEELAHQSSSLPLTLINLPMDVGNIYATCEFRVFVLPLSTLTMREVFQAPETVMSLYMLSVTPWRFLVTSQNNMTILDRDYTVVSTAQRQDWSYGPVILGNDIVGVKNSLETTIVKFSDSTLR